MLPRRAILASVLTAAAFPARAMEQWQIVTEYPASAMPGVGIATFAAGVTALSNNTLSVTPGFDAPGGLRSAAMLDAVAQGRVAAADAFTGSLANVAPIFQISALPFLTGSAADTGKLLAAARPAYQKELTARGLTLLYATPWPATGLWSRKPVPGPEALQGLRVRTYDATSTAVMQAAGAAPEQISFADAVPRLKDGSLDAVMSSGDGGAGAKLWEQLPNFTVLDYASPLSLAFCNSAALAALPRLAQAAVTQAAADTEIQQFRTIANRTGGNITQMQAHGVTIAEAPSVREALAKAAAPVLQAWIDRAGPEGAAIIAAYRAKA